MCDKNSLSSDDTHTRSNVIQLFPRISFQDEGGRPLDRFDICALLLAAENPNAPTADQLRELNELIAAQRADMLSGHVASLIDPREVLFSPRSLRRLQDGLQIKEEEEAVVIEVTAPDNVICIFRL